MVMFGQGCSKIIASLSSLNTCFASVCLFEIRHPVTLLTVLDFVLLYGIM